MTCATCHKVRAAIFSALAGGEQAVQMHSDHIYSAAWNVNIKYLAGATYHNVPDVVANSIVAAKAGSVMDYADLHA